MGSRKFIAVAMTLLALATAAYSSAEAQEEPSLADPALFDLDLAETRLSELRTNVARLQGELATNLDAIDGLTIRRDYIELNDQGRNEVMQASRSLARNMAISTYIGVGSGFVALDATSANDLSYQNGLLRQQASRMQEAAETYAVLAGEADATVLTLGDSINDELRQAEGASRDLARQQALIPHAEWVVSIARIHQQADETFARSRRAEPTAEQWRQLRFCESTETYTIDTGNSFYGAYQFTWETWGTVGGSDNPADAPPEEQDARARLLYADRGSQPWPVCGRFLP